MASKATTAAIILSNILLFTCVASCHVETPCSPTPRPVGPKPKQLPTPTTKCPKDTLKLGGCSSWLGLVSEVIGTKPSTQCCALVEGLTDLEAAACLCTAIKANALGIVKLKVPVALSLLVNGCGKKVPDGFQCQKLST
ncbi:hypothetical protein Droror1_Dr00015186 [Drosera rotundifolia]